MNIKTFKIRYDMPRAPQPLPAASLFRKALGMVDGAIALTIAVQPVPSCGPCFCPKNPSPYPSPTWQTVHLSEIFFINKTNN